MNKKSFALFTDVSLNPLRKRGVGGYLLVPVSFLDTEPSGIEQGAVSAQVVIRSFSGTSSTKLEVQTLLWAMEDVREELAESADGNLRIYTDSQCVVGLLRRRSVLEQNDFVAKRSGRPFANASLYRAFYAAYDLLGFQVIKVKGHARACSRDTVQRIFLYVDRAVRKALPLWLDLPE